MTHNTYLQAGEATNYGSKGQGDCVVIDVYQVRAYYYSYLSPAMTLPLHPKPPTTQSILECYFEFENKLLENDHGDDSRTKNRQVAPIVPCSYLNHGGFGSPHPSTLLLRQHLTSLCYQQPMVYHRSLVPALHARAKKRACDYLKISEESRDGFAFLPVTPALFGVLASVKFEEGDIIVTSDMIYHSLVDAISHMASVKKLRWIVVESPPGCDSQSMYSEFEKVLRMETSKSNVIKLIVFDHISSKPTVMFPVNKLCELCRSLKIPTLVDGAHVPGAVPSHLINVEGTKATFYCVTFHKWVNTPRGNSGGLWVNKKDVASIYSSFIDISALVVTGGWEDDRGKVELYLDASKPGYLTEGLTQGIYDESTREYENILVIPHCLDIVLKHEVEMQRRTVQLRSQSQSLLKEAWGLTVEETERWGGLYSLGDVALPMLTIPLPTEKLLKAATFETEDLALGKKLGILKKRIVPKLWEEYAIEVPVFVWKQTSLGMRISFGRQVEIGDIERLANAINLFIDTGY